MGVLKDRSFFRFFDMMLKRLQEKQGEYRDSWRYVDLDQLRMRIRRKCCTWAMSTYTPEELQELVDLANQCMLLYIRLKEGGEELDG